MTDKVGKNIPTEEQFNQLVADAKSINDRCKVFGITLTPDERRALLHARRNADPMVKRVNDLAIKYEVKIPGMSLDAMETDRSLRSQLNPIADILRSALTLIEDTSGQAESEMWETFLGYYGILSSMAERVPELAVELKPVIDFMASVRRRQNQPPTSES